MVKSTSYKSRDVTVRLLYYVKVIMQSYYARTKRSELLS